MPNSNSRRNIRFLQWNCRSIVPKKSELLLLIEERSPHIIALNETWLTASQSFVLPGYNIIRADRDDGYGGVLLAIISSIEYYAVNITSVYECVCVNITLQNERMNVVCMYVPPNCRLNSGDVGGLFDSIHNPKLILGDFNAHGALWGQGPEDYRGRTLAKAIEDCNLVCLNNGDVTRIACPPARSSAVDVAVCSDDIALKFNWCTTDNPAGSDHLPIILHFNHLISNTFTYIPNIDLTKYISWEQYTLRVDEGLNGVV